MGGVLLTLAPPSGAEANAHEAEKEDTLVQALAPFARRARTLHLITLHLAHCARAYARRPV